MWYINPHSSPINHQATGLLSSTVTTGLLSSTATTGVASRIYVANVAIDGSNKVAWYLAHVGRDAYNLLKDLSYPQPLGSKTVDECKTLLLGHLRPATFETTERAKFHNLVRRKGESYRNFLLHLRQQAAKCNFGSELLTQMRDRIVAGINDSDLQKRLLREPGLTYDRAKVLLEPADDVDSAKTAAANVFRERQTFLMCPIL